MGNRAFIGMKRAVTMCVMIVLVGFAIPVLAEVKPVLNITFDKDFNATDANGETVAGMVVDKPELVPGKNGQALLAGPSTGYVNFPAALLKASAGTVEMWVCPVDWKPDDKDYHFFFETKNEGALYLYKYFENTNLLMLSCDDVRGPYFSSPTPLEWKPGEWHHVVGTWSSDGVMSYVDGNPAGRSPTKAKLPVKLGDTFMIGSYHSCDIPQKSNSLIDEVRIYDRALNNAEVKMRFSETAANRRGAATYRQLPLKEKLADMDLTFAVTFDGFNFKADRANGTSDSTTLSDKELLLRGTIGFDGKQAYQPIGDEELFYAATGNISAKSGTVTMWVNAPSYDPSSKESDGKKRGNIALFEFMAKNTQSHLDFRLYEFADVLCFELCPSGAPQPSRQAYAKRSGIKKKEWHQVAITWNRDKLAIYLNGELGEETSLPLDIGEKMNNFAIDGKGSFFGIPLKVWDEKRKFDVQVDDLKVYSRALSRIEIKKQYQDIAENSKEAKLDLVYMTLNGVDATNGEMPDQIEVDMDFSILPEKLKALLAQGALVVNYTMTGSDGFADSGAWTCSRTLETKRISGIRKPGTYKMTCTIQDGNERIEAGHAEILRPDLSFIGNRIGYSDKVPAPWTPLVMKGRTVEIWNRVYKFGDGPFPESITAFGKNLLLQAPKLKISLVSGPEKIKYSAGKASFTEREAILAGRGAFAQYTFEYTTLVTYDGMIKTNLVIRGVPEIGSMTLDWQVAPASAQYLMTPCLNEDKIEQLDFSYPRNPTYDPTVLWFTSEKNGGFAYSMENDANWSYPNNYPVLKANKKTGKCEVTMIAQQVKLPEDTDYQVLFIATPTRPLVDLRRNIHFYGLWHGGSFCSGDRPLIFQDTRGLAEGQGSYKPQPGAFEKEVGKLPRSSFAAFGMLDQLTSSIPIANYFAKYYELPGAYIYPFNYERYNAETGNYSVEQTPGISACNATSVNDYFLFNQDEMIKHPYGDRLWMIYYDLCQNEMCGNKLHGCGFADKLGREIKTFVFLKKRRLIERSVQLAHDNGKVVLCHAQRDFLPFVHGLADYWFPGEQHNGIVLKNRNFYTDDIPDELYRTEYNSSVLGASVIFLPVGKATQQKVTEGMLCQLLLHDIELFGGAVFAPYVEKAWSILDKHVDSKTPFHRYYEQALVVSSNPNVRISYYEAPGPKYLVVLANKTANDANAKVDFSKLGITTGKMREEFIGGDLDVRDGKIDITVPSRSFRLIGYPWKQ